MPSFAHSINYQSLCADEAGKKLAGELNHKLDTLFTNFINGLDPVLAEMSKKQNPAEENAYNEVRELKTSISGMRDQNSSDWSAYCF